jgi:hypothetical protein
LLRANEPFAQEASAGDWQTADQFAQGKWIAFIDSAFRVVLVPVWPEVIVMHAGG